MPDPTQFIVAGGGCVGRQAAESLVDEGFEVVIVEQNSESVDELTDASLGLII